VAQSTLAFEPVNLTTALPIMR